MEQPPVAPPVVPDPNGDPTNPVDQLAAIERALVLRDEIDDLDRIAGLIEMSGGTVTGYEDRIGRYEAELRGLGLWIGNQHAFTGRKGRIEREFATRTASMIGTATPPTDSQVTRTHDLVATYGDEWRVPEPARVKVRNAFLALPDV